MKSFLPIFFVICLISYHSALAEDASITVHGTVTDTTGTTIPGAVISFLSDTDLATAFADADGYYEAVLTGWSTGVHETVPPAFGLMQNYPNPFNPTTTIPFSLEHRAPVRLDIFSITGQCIRTLIDGEIGAGTHTAVWDGLDDTARGVSAGVYIYRLRAGSQATARKMLLVDGHTSGARSAARPVSSPVRKPVTGQTYTIRAEKITTTPYTMTPYLGEIEVLFETPRIERDIVLPDRYRIYDLFFDTNGILNQYALSGDSLGITLGTYQKTLPEEGTVTLTSRAGDSETITVLGSAGYFKKWDYCATSRHYFPDSRSGSIATKTTSPITGDGILQVNAANDTISAVYVTPRGDTISTSIPLVDSIETVRLWGRTYYQWNDDWYWWRDDSQKWVLAQKNDFDITFDESVSLEVINAFIADNNLQVGRRRSDHNMSIRIDNAIYFLIEQRDNPIIDNAELIEQGCLTS